MSCARTALVRHCESKAHKESIKMGKEIAVAYKPLTSMFTSKSEPARLEIKICAFVVEKKLPISMAGDIIRFMKSLFPNNDVLQHVSLGKQKSTNLIRQVLGFHCAIESIRKLKDTKFSLIIDETTDCSTTSQLAILATVFCEDSFNLENVLIDLITLENGKAITIFQAVVNSLQEKGIAMENVVGFCVDTCNVMFGKNHSVATLLEKQFPWIMTIKCSCHLIHLCSSYAAKKLPKSLEDLCRNIYSHFAMSSQRTKAFAEFQEFWKTERHKILRPGQTRWLSMKTCVSRILEQYEALKLYFTAVVFEDPTHTHDAILKSVNNKFTNAYLDFLDVNLNRFVSFNLLFQSNVPQLYQLKKEVSALCRSLCMDFMTMSYVRGSEFSTLQPNDTSHHVANTDVYLGIAAKDSIKEIVAGLGNDHSDVQLYFSQCKEFVIEIVKQIQDRFDDCRKLEPLAMLEPDVAYNMRIPSIKPLYTLIPHLKTVAEEKIVEREWREHALITKLNEEMTCLNYWKLVMVAKMQLASQCFQI